jgi:hypothetical protein
MHLNVVRRRLLQGLVLLGFWLGAAGVHLQAQAQGVELASLNAIRQDGALTLDFVARVSLTKSVEDALQRGVPVYFVAQVELRRNRWYWRDERVARVSRSWRVAYQPITGTWRVGLGGLNQTHASMQEALTAASRSAAWRLADLAQLDPDSRYSIVFSYHLDTAQLPGPLQFGLVGQSDWVLSVDRVLRLE